jgi:mannosylfructose-phosphate synthase
MTENQHPIKHIAHLSTHGYVDVVPQLGQTDTGGQVVYVLKLAEALAHQDIRVDLFTRWFDKSKPQIENLTSDGQARLIRIPTGEWEFVPKEFIYDLLPDLADNLVDFIRNEKIDYDLFHGHYVDAGIVTQNCAQQLTKPAFFTAHSLGAWKRDQMGGDPEIMEKKYNFKFRVAKELEIFNAVLGQTVTSAMQLDKLHELYAFKKDNVAIIPPGVDIHRFTYDESNNVPDFPQIFCLSRIDTNKGHDLLLHAFAETLKKVPEARLIIGGGSAKPEAREREVLDTIFAIVDDYNIADSVHLLGYVSDTDLVEYYQRSDLFVLPSLFEPFGMTALEAMSCGTPIVASKFGGIRNVIADGDNGFLIDPTNALEFGQAVTRLLSDRSLCKRMGEKARSAMVQNYSWEAIAKQHIDFYRTYL